MLEGTNQSSHVQVISSLVGRNAYTLAGNPTDRITLGYTVNTQGHHMPRYTQQGAFHHASMRILIDVLTLYQTHFMRFSDNLILHIPRYT